MFKQTKPFDPASLRPFEPRKPGMVCFCGYWRQRYTVLSVTLDSQGVLRNIVIRWQDGHVGQHGTWWDWEHDQILSEAS